MKLAELQKRLSGAIYSLEIADSYAGIKPNGQENPLKVYQRNLLFGAVEKFSDVFPVTKLHMGEDGFVFFVRAYLIENGYKNELFNESHIEFLEFMNGKFETHGDELIVELMKIDYAIYHLTPGGHRVVESYDGVMNLWNAINTNGEIETTVDLSAEVAVEIKWDNNVTMRTRPNERG